MGAATGPHSSAPLSLRDRGSLRGSGRGYAQEEEGQVCRLHEVHRALGPRQCLLAGYSAIRNGLKPRGLPYRM